MTVLKVIESSGSSVNGIEDALQQDPGRMSRSANHRCGCGIDAVERHATAAASIAGRRATVVAE